MIRGRWRRFKGYQRTLELVNKQREERTEAEAKAEVDENAEIDSADSVICAYEFRMRMGELH